VWTVFDDGPVRGPLMAERPTGTPPAR
jgi:hypothetical protein